jgi:hypothetical protein
MAWVESVSPSFRARHDDGDADDTARVLDMLEHTRDDLGRAFARTVGDITVVVHGSDLQLGLAHPQLVLARLLTAPAGRRYMAGWYGAKEIHVLSPRALRRRASQVAGSRELLLLAPAALYAQLVVGTNNPDLPPPFRPRTFGRWLEWAWLAQGSGQYLAGQVAHLRPAVARRLREGADPVFPPGVRDAALLGGTVFELLAREEGQGAVVRLAASPLHPGGAAAALEQAFAGRPIAAIEARWRSLLERTAAGEG